MKHLSTIRHLPGARVRRDRKFALGFQFNETIRGDGIDGRALPGHRFQTLQLVRFDKALNTPIERASRRHVGVILQKFEQLLVADKPGVADLAEEWNVSLRGDYQTALGIPHTVVFPADTCSPVSSSAMPTGPFGVVVSCQNPQLVRTQSPGFINNITSC